MLLNWWFQYHRNSPRKESLLYSFHRHGNICMCVSNTHTHTHNGKDDIHHLAGEKCKSREPETLSNVWKKKQTGSEGCRNQRKKNITHRKEMCRLKPHFSPLEPSGHLSLEGLMQFFEQKLIWDPTWNIQPFSSYIPWLIYTKEP